MAKLTGNELVGVNNALTRLKNKPFKGVDSFKIVRAALKVGPEVQALEEARLKIVDKCVKKGEDGKYETEMIGEHEQYKIHDMETWTREFNELMAHEIEVEVDLIPISMFEDIEIEPGVIAELMPIIAE